MMDILAAIGFVLGPIFQAIFSAIGAIFWVCAALLILGVIYQIVLAAKRRTTPTSVEIDAETLRAVLRSGALDADIARINERNNMRRRT